MRENGKLNFARHFQFVVYGEELAGELFTGFAKNEMGVDAGLHDCGRKRFVDIVHGADFEASGFVVGFGSPVRKITGMSLVSGEAFRMAQTS